MTADLPTMPYLPLSGVRVLDLGILIPPALAGNKLVALGADVVKVEQAGRGDRIRAVPPLAEDGESSQHMGYNWGKRSITLDLRRHDDLETFFALANVADVILENQLPGFWARLGIDFAELRRRRPALIVCSLTGFGQTGPLAQLPSHGLNMDALADSVVVEWRDGEPHLGWSFTSWGNELGAANAAMAICAALAEVRGGGQGAWIDISCWDALVEAHRTDILLTTRTGVVANAHKRGLGPLYDTYLSQDGKAVLLGALERKFWINFCVGVDREDLIDLHTGAEIDFGPTDQKLREELRPIFAAATAEEWDRRFLAWDCPGATVLETPDIMRHPHFAARELLEGQPGTWPLMRSAIRWHHTGERAGAGLTPPPALGEHNEAIRVDWIGR
ncbi:CaiB/BaiF CoA-transferase family protein [Frankia sp. Cr2]|uniref:CaiB/BaiF CoA transferase family protein n=1 Tax=Frankia sp. Cr2 TaxID=3073932 RepID=UPI002AD2D460|nr:CaiB/BaiF CoA-transferase family protein [Frankia sp. Cr2]